MGATAAQPDEKQQNEQRTSNEEVSPASGLPVADAASTVQRILPYSRGRWRLASVEELDRTVLWFSHILIRYEGVLDADVSFFLADWHSAYPPSRLGRDEALQLARRIAAEAAQGTVSFMDLAAAYSEDITTIDRGGSLGGMTASHLTSWGQILDALEVLKSGQTSDVIETPYGFHVLQRRSPPPPRMVSGARIVIAHDDAGWLRHFHSRWSIPSRSRSEAELLAHDLYERARRDPARFVELVRRYSDHRDAEADGDLGQWSTLEPSAPAREIETLAGLPVGGVARPIDTLFGFQILMRTRDRPRLQFAHQAIELFFDPSAPAGHPDSADVSGERAAALGARLVREPQLFDNLRAEYCCTDTHVWTEGRAEPNVQAALSLLRVGAIGTTPVKTVASYALLRRLDPKQVRDPTEVRLELPSDGSPDMLRFLGWELEPKIAEGVVRMLGAGTVDQLALPPEQRARLLALHELQSGIGTGEERVRVVTVIDEGAKDMLAPADYERYRALRVRLIERAVLNPKASLKAD